MSAALADAHLHLFAGGFAERYDHRVAAARELGWYEALRRAYGIEQGLVVGFEGVDRFKGNNDELAGWAAERDWIAPVAYHAPDRPPDVADLDRRGGQRFVGISLYVLTEAGAEALSGWHPAVLDRLNQRRSVVSINALPECMAGMDAFVRALDGCAVLFSHLGLPGRHATPPTAQQARERLATLLGWAGLPQVGVKVSGLYAVSDPPHAWPHDAARPFVAALVESFGPERLYWGSDFPPAIESVSFAQAVDALSRFDLGLTPVEEQAVMGGSLLAVLDRCRIG